MCTTYSNNCIVVPLNCLTFLCCAAVSIVPSSVKFDPAKTDFIVLLYQNFRHKKEKRKRKEDTLFDF